MIERNLLFVDVDIHRVRKKVLAGVFPHIYIYIYTYIHTHTHTFIYI